MKYNTISKNADGLYLVSEVSRADITSVYLADGMDATFNAELAKNIEWCIRVKHFLMLSPEYERVIAINDSTEKAAALAIYESHKKAVETMTDILDGFTPSKGVAILLASVLTKSNRRVINFDGEERLVETVRRAYDDGLTVDGCKTVKAAIVDFFEKYGIEKDIHFLNIKVGSKLALVPTDATRKYTVKELVNSVCAYELKTAHDEKKFTISAKRKKVDAAFKQIAMLVLAEVLGFSLDMGGGKTLSSFLTL